LTLLSAAKILLYPGATIGTINSITCDETSALNGGVVSSVGMVSGGVPGVGTTNCKKIASVKPPK
jgi:hypothetical protein